MSDRFIATFLWLDKLGLGATLGMDVIIRQTIFDSNYGLLDENYIPNPVRILPVLKSNLIIQLIFAQDWWVSVLYKKLVGTKVLSLSNDGTTNNTIRLYAHCSKTTNNIVGE